MNFAQELGAARLAAGYYDRMSAPVPLVLIAQPAAQARLVEFPEDNYRAPPVDPLDSKHRTDRERILACLPHSAARAIGSRDVAELAGLVKENVSGQLSALRHLIRRRGSPRRYLYWLPATDG